LPLYIIIYIFTYIRFNFIPKKFNTSIYIYIIKLTSIVNPFYGFWNIKSTAWFYFFYA